jgi:crotonobetainyl-CoA:carnitine CoA-transferase CaiB-like acyl-CoA transferase
MARLPLEDIRIIDFTWVLAGSHATRLLADLGAQVIKVESKAKLDGWRIGYGMLREGVTSPLEEGSGIFEQENRNKIGLCLNITVPRGREVFERLVKISDVVTANLSPRGFVKMGLEWEKLREVNPRIIVVSMPGLGNWGPYSGFITFGPNLQALSGMTGLTGYPGQQPVGVGTPWADYLAGVTMATAILAALEYRQKSGKGQFIDISQQEACTSVLGSYLLDWESNKRMRENQGNHHPAAGAAPHSCYKCKGEDRWCVISVASDKEWDSFCDVLGNPAWTKDSMFATALNRIHNQEELDKLVEAWTVNYSPEEVTQMMQRAGVSAGVVQNIQDIIEHDTHLRERGFLVDLKLPHPDRKPQSVILPGVVTNFAGTELTIRHPAPGRLGEDNVRLLKEILGMTEEEIDLATADGAFE